eukprot:m.63917 g.63917  ORF g.63917 m.63917 type:complete len:160 (+) comp23362_c3_seq2:125-604(+)
MREGETGISGIQGFQPTNLQQDAAPIILPPGWEARLDKQSNKLYYINHTTKTTSWEKPTLPATSNSQPQQPPQQQQQLDQDPRGVQLTKSEVLEKRYRQKIGKPMTKKQILTVQEMVAREMITLDALSVSDNQQYRARRKAVIVKLEEIASLVSKNPSM